MNLFLRLAFVSLAWFSTLLSTAQTTWTVDNTPMPHLEDRTRYVINPEGLMSVEAQTATDHLLRQLQDSIGVQGMVVVVGRVAGGDCYEYILRLAQKYGVGQRNSTGFAMVVALEDRCYYIVTGRGLEGVLPDATVHQIEAETLVPALKQGHVDNAVYHTISRMASVALSDSTLSADGTLAPKAQTDSRPPWWVGLIVFTVFLIALIVYARRRRKRCPQCHQGDWYVSHIGKPRLRGHRWMRQVTYQCTRCNYVEQREEEDPRSGGNHGSGNALLWGTLLGSALNSRSRGGFGSGGLGGGSFGGGGFSGGSFGGGSFGGGGAGGRF